VFARTRVGDDASLLEIACGSGLARMTATHRGATVAGRDLTCMPATRSARTVVRTGFSAGKCFVYSSLRAA
jgi:hypothetical protein